MSRQQIAQFSAFLMRWISDTANHEAVSNAVIHAINVYNDERGSSQAAFSDFRYAFDVDVRPFSDFSKDDFFRLCSLLESLKGRSPADGQKLIQRVLWIKEEYEQTDEMILGRKTTDKLVISDCEYWRSREFSKKDIELLKALLPGSNASALWAKLPLELSDQEEMGFQFYLDKARQIADKVGDAVKVVAAAARAKAIDLTSNNSAVFFPIASLASPNARDFLLSIDSRGGSWEVKGAGVGGTSLFSGHTSLKTRMIYEVCHAYFLACFVERDSLFVEPDSLAGMSMEEEDDGGAVGDEFITIPENAVKLLEQSRSARSSASLSPYEQQETKILQLYARKIISPLTKPGHALQIYQGLLAIDCDAKVMQLTTAAASERVAIPPQEKVGKSDLSAVEQQTHDQSCAAAALAVPPQRLPNPHQLFTQLLHADDDDFVDPNDNRRSVAEFKHNDSPPQ